ncbi:hypothetical protein PLEOSDRAFT_170716 [Pleurotus ostreatus PC15]|uniref:Uncharacterized protein n=1 Tax=Pleurotus ostreatus (strain PC15) TaxID=1137138 RepID=A0A067N4V5_PLEO1|nr:hypothetical protein PLEOSDRAFT_170716 [Pleurotus ostreatus PC15]
MTRLSMVKSLLSNQRDVQRQTIKVTLNFLTRDQTKQEMSERLGYNVEQLSTWVIINGRHQSTDGAHITIRGFQGKWAAITVHIYVDEWYRYEDYAAWLNGKKLRQKTTQLRKKGQHGLDSRL